jgi:hypothetical protein
MLATGSGRFGAAGDDASKPPLAPEDATAVVADDCVLYRRHTQLKHLCVYEIGVDIDHRGSEVGAQLLRGLADEAKKRGIDRGFAISSVTDSEALTLFSTVGAVPIPDPVVLALQF